MTRDISKASLIPSYKWDTSAEEMGVTRTQEDPKKNVDVKFQVSSILKWEELVEGVTEVPQLRGWCLQQQEKINPTLKLILRKREVKYLNLCPGGFGGTTNLEEVFLPTLTESSTPHTRMSRDISKASLIPANKWYTSAEEMGVTRTQEDPKKNIAVKFQVSSILKWEGEGSGGGGGPSITGSVFAATGEDQPNSEIDSSEERS
ncbi:hypothetical protein CDAR_242791 [Caerostris darwini]|uniref:Uncharacterized protein n=1 Tax=Caerostris darwini TaxID=1538125 RepID=A0AAV4W1R5_9ARAC|nr:hypothetical protein CDAR_242791 [Caerostris darwini]